MKEQAEKYLNDLNLDILTQEELDQWYEDMIKIMPVSPVALSDWEEHTGYLKKAFYIRGGMTMQDFAILRVAYFYPDGTSVPLCDEPVISIEEE